MDEKLTSVLTGDIVNSRTVDPQIWLSELKKVLKKTAISSKNWEIFRGDAFQMEIDPNEALSAAIYIKSALKQHSKLDVRIAIGVGAKEYQSSKISLSNGEAFVNSGKCFENLNKNRLAIITPWPEIDKELNLYMELASLTTDNWPPRTAEIIKTAFENKDLNQKALSVKLKRSQSTISATLKRGGYDELEKLIDRYKTLITKKIQ